MVKAFRALPRQNLAEQVVREIGLSIMRNDFKPGETLLSEPELSLQFNVSRPVTREALKVLSAKGLIEARPRRGTRVRPRAAWNILDPEVIEWLYEVGPEQSFLASLCEVRLMFEPMAARLAAVRATDEHIQALEACLTRLKDALDSLDAYISADMAFHAAICAAAHNEVLQKITETLTTPLRASRVITSRLPGANRAAMPLHGQVAAAIRERNELEAEKAMRELVLLTTSDIQQALEHKKSTTNIQESDPLVVKTKETSV